jgi:hypothetical protein
VSATAASAPLLLEPHRLWAGPQRRALAGLPSEDQLATALTALEEGPTQWVVDDLWAPSLLLRDVTELPEAAEAREAFWRWRYQQGLGLSEPAAVRALQIEQGLWLLGGLREEWKAAWTALAARLNRPIRSLVPRWLALYNHLAPEQHAPGILLSLAPHPSGGFTGTLAAWGHQLCLLRQWADPLSEQGWMEERVLPSLAFLQREGRQPQSLQIFGAPRWPETGLPTRFLVEADLEEEA